MLRMLKLIRFIRPWAKYLLAGWILAIISVSSTPGIPTLKIHTQNNEIRIDYLLHIIEYGSLTFLALLTFSDKKYSFQPQKLLFIIAVLVIFALVDELHQKIIPGRSYNIYDFFSNLAGIIVGSLISLLLFRRAEKDYYS